MGSLSFRKIVYLSSLSIRSPFPVKLPWPHGRWKAEMRRQRFESRLATRSRRKLPCLQYLKIFVAPQFRSELGSYDTRQIKFPPSSEINREPSGATAKPVARP